MVNSYLCARELPHVEVRQNGDDLDRVDSLLGVVLFHGVLDVVKRLLDSVNLSVSVHVCVLQIVNNVLVKKSG